MIKKWRTKLKIKLKHKAWVACVNMGYGHQRTAHPLKGLAYKGQIINANDYPGIPESDKKIWEDSRRFYEAISRFKRIPIVGGAAFSFYDNFFQKIIEFYPNKDLSRAPIFDQTHLRSDQKRVGAGFCRQTGQSIRCRW